MVVRDYITQVCIYWDNSSGTCTKSVRDTISHVCWDSDNADGSLDKLNNWPPGSTYQKCTTEFHNGCVVLAARPSLLVGRL